MQLAIRPLTPDLLEDYLHFFDNVAFSDHPEWSWCYCTFYHLSDEDMKQLDAEYGDRLTRDVTRSLAADLIRTGRLLGYLAYRDGEVVGWCNAAGKGNYKRLRDNGDLWPEGENLRIKSVTCFVVAPDSRRQGVAKALLEQVAADAAGEGYDVLEAYPAVGELDCFGHYHGHPAMYEACDFDMYKDLGEFRIYRKVLMNE